MKRHFLVPIILFILGICLFVVGLRGGEALIYLAGGLLIVLATIDFAVKPSTADVAKPKQTTKKEQPAKPNNMVSQATVVQNNEDPEEIHGIPKSYYDSLSLTTRKLSTFKRQIHLDIPTIDGLKKAMPDAHQIPDEMLNIAFCIDAVRCYRGMGASLDLSKPESFGLVKFWDDVTNSYGIHYKRFREYKNLESFCRRVTDYLSEISLYENKLAIGRTELLVPFALEKSSPELKNQYLVLLYRWASVVAKFDNTITSQESTWLANMLKIQSAPVQKATTTAPISKPEPKPVVEQKPAEQKINPLDQLNSLIGLDSVKSEISTLANFIKVQEARKAAGMKVTSSSFHCVFTGNPGTGKTTVARIVASIYKELGLIKKGHLVETDRSGLVGEYIGQTAIKTNAIIDSALDGILFIDEAYALGGEGRDFGKEAVATLIKRMEDERERLVVILAGYTDEMQKFLDTNPGLQSRFNRYIHFPDYSANEMLEIFESYAKQYEYQIQQAARARLMNIFNYELSSKNKNFGNARFVRNLFDKTIERQANRLAREPRITNDMLAEITVADISYGPIKQTSIQIPIPQNKVGSYIKKTCL